MELDEVFVLTVGSLADKFEGLPQQSCEQIPSIGVRLPQEEDVIEPELWILPRGGTAQEEVDEQLSLARRAGLEVTHEDTKALRASHALDVCVEGFPKLLLHLNK